VGGSVGHNLKLFSSPNFAEGIEKNYQKRHLGLFPVKIFCKGIPNMRQCCSLQRVVHSSTTKWI
jgi:hypothetical protein